MVTGMGYACGHGYGIWGMHVVTGMGYACGHGYGVWGTHVATGMGYACGHEYGVCMVFGVVADLGCCSHPP